MATKKRAKKAHKSASKKRRGVVAWVEGLFGMNKKKAKSRKSSHKKSAKRKSSVATYSLKAKKSGSRTHKKYAK